MSLRRFGFTVASVLACTLSSSQALAGSPIMGLSQVKPGMRCTGLTVLHGTSPIAFDVTVTDVLPIPEFSGTPMIVVETSGPAVDKGGIAAGFSGSPVLCPDLNDPASPAKIIGAIGYALPEYGNKVGLATPIETMLAIAVDPPRQGKRRAVAQKAPRARGGSSKKAPRVKGSGKKAARVKGSRRPARRLGRPVALSGTVFLTGLSEPLRQRLARSQFARRHGIVATSGMAFAAGLGPTPVIQPGSAIGAALATGDLTVGAQGTVSYVDGNNVWAFAHALQGLGPRQLPLIAAYVSRVLSDPNPAVGSTKLGLLGRPIGTLTNDTIRGVAGKLGGIPASYPLRFSITDSDRGKTTAMTVNIFDERAIDKPMGAEHGPNIAAIGVFEALTRALSDHPTRLTGEMSLTIKFRQAPRPIILKRRYVTRDASIGDHSGFASAAAETIKDALTHIEEWEGSPLTVDHVNIGFKVRRGSERAILSAVRMPRRARPGQRVRIHAIARRPNGPSERVSFMVQLPHRLGPGRHRLTLQGPELDNGDQALFERIFKDLTKLLKRHLDDSDDSDRPARNIAQLRQRISKLERYDGLRLMIGGRGGKVIAHAFRTPNFRISGKVSGYVQIIGKSTNKRLYKR